MYKLAYTDIEPTTMQVPLNRLRIALLFNLKHAALLSPDAPADALAEYSTQQTVDAVSAALEAAGHEVIPLEADPSLLDAIRRVNPDLCFNMARGIDGRDRQSQAPALLEMLNIPFTGSNVKEHAVALDKATVKRIWHEAGLPVAPFQVFATYDAPVQSQLDGYPLFVKPLHEGSGMGVDAGSIVFDEHHLRARVRWTIEAYQQPALVETYLPGREFVIGAVGNGAFLHRSQSDGSRFYDFDGYHLFPILEIDATEGIGQGVYSAAARAIPPGEPGAPVYHCPARLPPLLEKEMRRLAVAAITAIDAMDLACVNLRLDVDGAPYLMEIDTLPTLDPVLSNLTMAAQAEGLTFQALITEILHLAMDRNHLSDSRARLSHI